MRRGTFQDRATLQGSTGERFCSQASARFFAGDNSSLVYSASDRTARMIPQHLAVLLERCRTFKTLDEHTLSCVDFFAQSRRGTQPPSVEAIRRSLSALADAGLLISERAVLDACRQSNQAQPCITSTGIITRNRTENLERCLRSYIENGRRYERATEFVVMDDSDNAKAGADNKDLLSLLKREYDADISYAGWEEKRRFAKLLASESSLNPDVINFALIDAHNYEFSCGKNRNALFLHTIGELIFSTDDDAVCRIAAPAQSNVDHEQEAMGQPLTPVEIWFFADREEALESGLFVEEDLLAVHERLLGRELADCLADFGDIALLSLERPLAYHLRSLDSGDARVLVTLSGMIGDSGMRLPVTYRILGPSSRKRLIESENTYRVGGSSREVLRAATRYCVSTRTWFISTALGYDNRDLLPPFFPVLRGTDGIFSATLGCCCEYGYFGDVPRAVLHAPTPPRSYDRESVTESATGITINSLIIACLSSQQFVSGSADISGRMQSLGKHLIEIGSMSLRDFEEFARLHLWREQSSKMANLEKEFMRYQNPPDYWARDLKEYLATIRASLAKPEYVVPLDLRKNRSLEQARELSRQLVMNFGSLLCDWPNMIEAARRLRARGERLALPI
ncbi:MAG: hypothetical protein WCB68_00680 [Pyrinomonadaceae bacterium]